MTITKIVASTLLVASITSLFGATGSSDSDAGKKYNMAYIDCEADGNKKFIMDYVRTEGGLDFTKHINQLKRASKFSNCTISGKLEIPYDIERNVVEIKSNINTRSGWNGRNQNPIINGKEINKNLAYGINVLGSGKNKFVNFNLNFGSYNWELVFKQLSSLQFTLVMTPQKRGELNREILLRYFVTE